MRRERLLFCSIFVLKFIYFFPIILIAQLIIIFVLIIFTFLFFILIISLFVFAFPSPVFFCIRMRILNLTTEDSMATLRLNLLGFSFILLTHQPSLILSEEYWDK